jgi:DNA-binding beta-propeller fold protein YncE
MNILNIKHRILPQWFFLALGLIVSILPSPAQTPQATEMPGSVFSIRHTWTIGGEGNWDYLTLDPSALRLYVAHGTTVQVVDVNEGKVVGEIASLRDAHEIALDDQGHYGYISDGAADAVEVFDRESFEVVAKIPTGRNPRALIFDPATHLLFVVCPSSTTADNRNPRRNAAGQIIPPSDPSARSTVSVIDADTNKRLADLIFPGRLGFAQTDGKGTVFINVTDRNQIAHFNATGIESRLRRLAQENPNDPATPNSPPSTNSGQTRAPGDPTYTIDWTDSAKATQIIPRTLHTFNLGQACQSPKSLSIDSANERLFVACDNMKMQVLDASSGDVVATLPIGAGTDAIGYDSNHGLIYAANGGGVGSLTIIRQHLSDSYAVVQELPTQARARTLAVNPTTGEVYLVTNVTGIDLTHKGGVGDLKPAALQGSFQVIVVGN